MGKNTKEMKRTKTDKALESLSAEVKTCNRKLKKLVSGKKKVARQLKELSQKLDEVELCKCSQKKDKKKKKTPPKKADKRKAVKSEVQKLKNEVQKPKDMEKRVTAPRPFQTGELSNILQLGIVSKKDSDENGLSNTLDTPRNGTADNLKWIAGVGPKLEDTLNNLGVYHFEQIANWTEDEVDWVDNYLEFSGRIRRDNWIEQAKTLAKGGWSEYVKVFGKEPR